MSSTNSPVAIMVALGLAVVGGLARLFLGDLLRAKSPKLYAWLTDYRGQVARWACIGVVMCAATGFCIYLGVTMKTGPTGNRVVLFGFGAVSLSVVFLAVLQSRKVLRIARLEGFRR